jgi:hypothetical protein
MMNGPAWAACKSKIDCGEWPTVTEYRAFLVEKGLHPGEVLTRVIAYAKEPEFNFCAEVATDELLTTLRSFSLERDKS